MNRDGIALPAALLALLALHAVVAGAAQLSLVSSRLAVSYDAYQRVLAAAEGGLERGVEELAAAYEAGAPPADSLLLFAASLGAVAVEARVALRREPATADLNGNGVPGEVVRYDRSWGFTEALRGGGADPGEPVRWIVAAARAPRAAEEVLLEVAVERDPAVADPRTRGAWRAVPLRWSGIVGHR